MTVSCQKEQMLLTFTEDLHAVIVYTATLELGWNNNRFCKVQSAEYISKRNFAFALKRESNWNRQISELLLTYKENKIIDAIKSKCMAPKCKKQLP